jgi:hypothetical protein
MDLVRRKRLKNKFEKIKFLQVLMAEHEQRGNITEVKRIIVRIRLLRQELLYMGKAYPEFRISSTRTTRGKYQ